MTIENPRTWIGALLVAGSLVTLAGSVSTGRHHDDQGADMSRPSQPGEAADRFSPHVDAEGAISLPENYRRDWVHMGTVVVPADEQTGFHDVYTQRSAVEAYRATGEFPDGAVLVKEVRDTRSGTLTTGDSLWGGEIDHWFVMIKDRKGRFPESPIWGEGWGWALFDAREPGRNTTTNFRASCVGCHIPARADDWVFVESYPTLSRSGNMEAAGTPTDGGGR